MSDKIVLPYPKTLKRVKLWAIQSDLWLLWGVVADVWRVSRKWEKPLIVIAVALMPIALPIALLINKVLSKDE